MEKLGPAFFAFFGVQDEAGNREDARAGSLMLGIELDDGRQGTLLISCKLVGSPVQMFEGISAVVGQVFYKPGPSFTVGVDPMGNPAFVSLAPTLFHVIGPD